MHDSFDSRSARRVFLGMNPDAGTTVMQGVHNVGPILVGMIKGAFIFGGKHGRAARTCKLPDGRWSAPAFFTRMPSSVITMRGAGEMLVGSERPPTD
jgi:lipid-binding SYLF domain-containing protein